MKKLDSFKIHLTLTELQRTLTSLWLQRFHSQSVHVWSTPILDGQILTIHPADFTNLISFAKPGDCSELEFYRLRKLGADAIEATLAKQRSKLSQELRDMTLDALRGLAPVESAQESHAKTDLSL